MSDRQPEAERFLSPDELSALLGIPVATLYSWRVRNEGPPGIRIGRHVRYRKSDIDRWLDDRADSGATS